MLARVSILLVSAGLLLAQDARVERASKLAAVERAWKLAADGRQEEAIRLLNDATRQDPDDPDARLLLGSLLSEAGHRDEAFLQLNDAVRLRPGSAEAWNTLGEAYSNFGFALAARHAFERAVEIDPKSGIAQLNLGRSLLEGHELRDEEVAVVAGHLDRAIHLLKPDVRRCNCALPASKSLYPARQHQQAVSELQRALSIRAEFPEAWSDLGEARKGLLDDTGATAAFERAVKLNANDPVAQYRLGAEYLKQSRDHLAAVIWSKPIVWHQTTNPSSMPFSVLCDGLAGSKKRTKWNESLPKPCAGGTSPPETSFYRRRRITRECNCRR